MNIILDAGSGLRELGLKLAKFMPLKVTFFFSHVHWDHIQGFPFFIPGFVPGNEFTLYGPKLNRRARTSVLRLALRNQQKDLNFPVQLSNMPAKMTFSDLEEGEIVEIEGDGCSFKITPGKLNHPGGCFGYRIEEHRDGKVRTFVYATDTEHIEEGLNPSLQALAKDADLLFYDAQYTLDEYEGKGCMSRKGWGHSTWLRGIQEARAANVPQLLLTHHDPLHDDWAVARIENDARKEGLRTGMTVAAACEGMEVEL